MWRNRPPIEIFKENIEGAERMLELVGLLENSRPYRMRRERREAIGELLRLGKHDRESLDCVEPASKELFIVLKKPKEHKEYFTAEGLKPLLRQIIVLISAAVESYVADRAITYISDITTKGKNKRPKALDEVVVPFRKILAIEEAYKRHTWGYREILEEYIKETASPASGQIGQVFKVVGRSIDFNKLDRIREVPKGTTTEELKNLYRRRNKIAHEADRKGSRKRPLVMKDVRKHLENAVSIVDALERYLHDLDQGLKRPSRLGRGTKPSVGSVGNETDGL